MAAPIGEPRRKFKLVPIPEQPAIPADPTPVREPIPEPVPA